MRKLKNVSLILGVFLFFIFQSCSKDDSDAEGKKGAAAVKLTDAPVDNAEVKGVFVTVADVKIDGESHPGFKGKQTIDLMAYQNGNFETLAEGVLAAKSYSNVSLVLDLQSNAEGNGPGCYVLKEDGSKDTLSLNGESNAEIKLNHQFDLESESQNDLIIDFDLRKTITAKNGNYNFVAANSLQSGLRIENEKETGHVKGKFEDEPSDKETFVVYAYVKGNFNAETETQNNEEDELLFANAVTSAKVNSSGEYQLSFLEKGEYELTVAKYEQDTSGNATFTGVFNFSLSSEGNIFATNVVEVESGVSANIDINLEGLVNLGL